MSVISAVSKGIWRGDDSVAARQSHSALLILLLWSLLTTLACLQIARKELDFASVPLVLCLCAF